MDSIENNSSLITFPGLYYNYMMILILNLFRNDFSFFIRIFAQKNPGIVEEFLQNQRREGLK